MPVGERDIHANPEALEILALGRQRRRLAAVLIDEGRGHTLGDIVLRRPAPDVGRSQAVVLFQVGVQIDKPGRHDPSLRGDHHGGHRSVEATDGGNGVPDQAHISHEPGRTGAIDDRAATDQHVKCPRRRREAGGEQAERDTAAGQPLKPGVEVHVGGSVQGLAGAGKSGAANFGAATVTSDGRFSVAPWRIKSMMAAVASGSCARTAA